ncbi:MAG: pentapeptide repeat-containing protein [Parvularculaceae bacterium]|nr:pentapeptide repeat-containing protein [Parvularculaceae bacterium]
MRETLSIDRKARFERQLAAREAALASLDRRGVQPAPAPVSAGAKAARPKLGFWEGVLAACATADDWRAAVDKRRSEHPLEFADVDFSDAAAFGSAPWWRADMKSPAFDGFDFSEFEFKRCVFVGALFAGVRFGKSLLQVRFEGCEFFDVDSRHVEAVETRFIKCTFNGGEAVRSAWRKCEFHRCGFLFQNFYQSEFVDTKFFDNDIDRGSFSECQFVGSSLRGGPDPSVNIYSTNFTRSYFREKSVVEFIVFRNCDLEEAYYSDKNHALKGVSFDGCSLNRMNLELVEINDVNFANSDLSGVNFTRAKLTKVDFTGAKLAGAEFGGVKLKRGDLKGKCADVRGAEDIVGNSILARAIARQEFPDTLRKEFMERLASYRPDWAPAALRPLLAFIWGVIDGFPNVYALLSGAVYGAVVYALAVDQGPFAGDPSRFVWPAICGIAAFGLLNSTIAKRLLLSLWGWTIDYGRDIDRMATLSVVTIALFGLAYHHLDRSNEIVYNKVMTDECAASLETRPAAEAVASASAPAPSDKPAAAGGCAAPWFQPFVVAALSFATLGVGDYVTPLTSLAAGVLIANVISGFVILGLFLAALSNVFSR